MHQEEWIELVLVPSHADPSVNSPEFQKELAAFSRALRAAGVQFSQRGVVFDSVDTCGYSLAEYTFAAAGFIITVLRPLLVAWLQHRNDRKTRLKIGDIELEARTPDEIDQLLLKAEAFRKRANVTADTLTFRADFHSSGDFECIIWADRPPTGHWQFRITRSILEMLGGAPSIKSEVNLRTCVENRKLILAACTIAHLEQPGVRHVVLLPHYFRQSRP